MKVRSKAQFEAIEWDGGHSTLIRVLKAFPKAQFNVTTNYLGNLLLVVIDQTRFPVSVGDYLVSDPIESDKCSVLSYSDFDRAYEIIPVDPAGDPIEALAVEAEMKRAAW